MQHRATSVLRFLLVLTLGWTTIMAAAPVLAQTAALSADAARARDEALELFKQGRGAYQAGDYGAALDLFRKAQARYDREPLIILALAKTLDRASDLETARKYYKLFLTTAPTDKKEFTRDREGTVKRLKEIEDLLAARPGVLKFKGLPSGAQLEIDAKSADVDASGEIKLPAGTYKVRVTMDKRLPFERAAIAIGPGETKEIDVVLLAPVDTNALPHDYTWTWVASGATVAALAVTGVYGVLLLNASNDYSQKFDADGTAKAATLAAYTVPDKDGTPIACSKGNPLGCPGAIAEGDRLIESFDSRRNGLLIGVAATAVLTATAVVLYLEAPLKDPGSKLIYQPAKSALRLTPFWDGAHTGAVLALHW